MDKCFLNSIENKIKDNIEIIIKRIIESVIEELGSVRIIDYVRIYKDDKGDEYLNYKDLVNYFRYRIKEKE